MSQQRQNVSGLLLFDKPKGLTSNQALQDVKHLLNAKKAGHTGSLDPLATGLLPLCFGEATKLSSFLLDFDKTYQATFKLGQTTDTYDSDGEITQTRQVNVSREDVHDAVQNFIGVLDQIPPMYSALKKDGKPLYELARQGVEVKRDPRRVSLYEFKLLNFDSDELDIFVKCSSGFYVRSLAYDLGEVLGCGAHVSHLRRLNTSNLSVDQAITINQLRAMPDSGSRQKLLQPADQILNHLDNVELTFHQVERLFQGQSIIQSGLPSKGLVRLYLQSGRQFVGIGLIIQGQSIKPKRLVNPQSLNLNS